MTTPTARMIAEMTAAGRDVITQPTQPTETFIGMSADGTLRAIAPTQDAGVATLYWLWRRMSKRKEAAE